MSYKPTNWIDGETPVNAANLNKLEQEVASISRNGGGGGSGLSMTLLWENASPTSEFVAQTIALDLSDFDMVAVTFKFESGWAMTRTEFAYMDIASCMCEHWREGLDYSRNFRGHSEGVLIAEGYRGTEENNQYCIPLRIYGIKGVIE